MFKNIITKYLPILADPAEALEKQAIPQGVQFLYTNLVIAGDAAFSSLGKLRAKVIATPNEVDDTCFNAGLELLEKFGRYVLEKVESLRITKDVESQ